MDVFVETVEGEGFIFYFIVKLNQFFVLSPPKPHNCHCWAGLKWIHKQGFWPIGSSWLIGVRLTAYFYRETKK